MAHSVFTIIAPVEQRFVGKLRDVLGAMGYLGEAPASDPLNFVALEMLHYASLFLYDDPDDGWFLVFESNIDNGIESYLKEIIVKAKQGDRGKCLLGIYHCCRGFEGKSLDELAAYWLGYVQRPAAAYVGSSGRTRTQILLERDVYEIADRTLGFGVPLVDEKEMAAKVRNALAKDGSVAGWETLPTRCGLMACGAWASRLGFDLVVALLWLPILLALIAYNALKEAIARQDTWRPDSTHVRSLRAKEDFLPTNHMVSVVHLHRDWSRLTAKRAAFAVLNFVALYYYTRGSLGEIPTIQFAHWAFLNRGRRLLFVSNYDGSWDSYLDDFTLKAARGLTLAWAHGTGFPRSRFMYWGGAARGPEFIDWSRRSMVPTLAWYSAYPGLSVSNINRNTRLRKAIAADKNGENKENWLGWI